jgi:type IV secretory pathway TrbF-like protein
VPKRSSHAILDSLYEIMFIRRPNRKEPPLTLDDKGHFVSSGTQTYLAAKAEWNERYGSYISQARSWRLAALLSMGVAIGCVAGISYIGSQSHIVPFVVEINQLGDALAAQRADVAATPDARLIRAQLARWISDVRTVYVDASAERYVINEAYGMIDRQSEAFAVVNAYFRKNDPFARAAEESTNVHISSVLPISATTWRVEWDEESHKRDGSSTGVSHWRGSVTVTVHPPTDSNTILINPTGLYVQSVSWSRAQ